MAWFLINELQGEFCIITCGILDLACEGKWEEVWKEVTGKECIIGIEGR
jgi:hypothetical protein